MTAFDLGLHLDRQTVGKAEEQAALKQARLIGTNVRWRTQAIGGSGESRR